MAIKRTFRILAAAALFSWLGAGAAFAIGGDDGESAQSPDYAKAVKLIKEGKYEAALSLLHKEASKKPKNPDVQNYLGYSYRKLKRFDEALNHYQAALRIDPKHLGANEYLGELYLQTGQLAKAEERLKVLDRACFFGCEEYDDLKKAIADFRAGKFKGG